MKEVIRPARIPYLLGELKACYTSSFQLELVIYQELRGSHNKTTRKEIAKYLGLPAQNYNIVELADHIRSHFDQLRLF